MRKQVGATVIAVLILATGGFSSHAQEDALVEFSSAAFGVTGLRPAAWTEVAAGTYSRMSGAADNTIFISQSAPLPPEQMLPILLSQLGLAEAPEIDREIETAAFVWTIRMFEVEAPGIGTLAVDLAIADSAGATHLIILQAAPDEIEALRQAVFLPAVEALAPIIDAPTPPYADISMFTEEEVTFGLEDWQLPGTLTQPSSGESFPIVIFVHGSGPQDRDETLGPQKVFRDLAWGLAMEGIASLRYDKRTFVHPVAFSELPAYTIDDEVTDDALAAIEFARGLERVDTDRIFVLGHSWGGQLGPRIASRDAEIGGLILMAAPARSFGTLLSEQIDYIAGLAENGQQDAAPGLAGLEALAEQLLAVEAGTDAAELTDEPLATYLTSIVAYDQVATAESLSIPMLVLQGDRDYQVTLEDFALWQKALEDHEMVSFVHYETLHHTFMATGDLTRLAIPADFAIQDFVSAQVIDDIARWILGG